MKNKANLPFLEKKLSIIISKNEKELDLNNRSINDILQEKILWI